jgi:hypothetical protein
MRVASLFSTATAALCLSALAPPQASAQDYFTVTPTYQVSLSRREAAPSTGGLYTQGWGLMVGMERPGSRWSPHLWVQRYTEEMLCIVPNPAVRATCRNSGWMISVGPALRLVDHGPWWSRATADLDLRRGSSPGLNGGLGLHVGVRWGAFVPQAFTRVARFNGLYYQTLGVAVRLELR